MLLNIRRCVMGTRSPYPRCARLRVWLREPAGEYLIGREARSGKSCRSQAEWTQRGAAGRIKILRLTDSTEHEIKAELDDRVRPGDTIVVPERFF